MIDKKNDSDMESCLQSAVASASQLLEGTIIKGYSGFYYVSCAGVLYECSLREKISKKKSKFLPGDKVQFSVIGDGVGAIETRFRVRISYCARLWPIWINW